MVLWGGLLRSGLHATLAVVLTAFFVPARTRIVPAAPPQVIRRSAGLLEARAAGAASAMKAGRFGAISVLSRTLDAANSPLQRFEHLVQPWVSFGILPVFALLNVGVAIDAPALRSLPTAVREPGQTGHPAGVVAGSYGWHRHPAHDPTTRARLALTARGLARHLRVRRARRACVATIGPRPRRAAASLVGVRCRTDRGGHPA